MRPVAGGLLLQTADRIDAPGDAPSTWSLQTGEPADAATLADHRPQRIRMEADFIRLPEICCICHQQKDGLNVGI